MNDLIEFSAGTVAGFLSDFQINQSEVDVNFEQAYFKKMLASKYMETFYTTGFHSS
jgi:hypothetical protein